MAINKYTEAEALNIALGETGTKTITSTDGAVTGNFVGIIVLQDATISAMTASNSTLDTGYSNILNINLSQGMSFPLRVSSITLSSGVVMLIKG
jgi:hypothetical protein